MANRKKWSELSSAEQAQILTLVAVQAVLAAWAQRDLSSRSASEVRGPKMLWRLLTLNTAGTVAYILVGRVQAPGGVR